MRAQKFVYSTDSVAKSNTPLLVSMPEREEINVLVGINEEEVEEERIVQGRVRCKRLSEELSIVRRRDGNSIMRVNKGNGRRK